MESSECPHSLEFYRGLDLFNREFYYECHEVWEEIWMEAKGEKKIFYQALIMAAVSLYHFGNENLRGALSCHQKAVAKFQQLPGYYLSIDLEGFKKQLNEFYVDLLVEGTIFTEDLMRRPRPKLRLEPR